MHILRRITAAAILLVSGAAAASAQTYQLGQIEISVPWTRAMPPAADAGGGFMTIRNTGATDDRLVGATSPVAAEVQIHTMDIADGVMRMRQLTDGLAIPAGATVRLAPGGFHVMFLDLPTPIAIDMPVSVTLVFERAGEITIDLIVVPPGAPAPDGAGAMGGAMDAPLATPAAH
ncbi:MAG: copper chaperone PCu(A)C [Bauldia sp.]|nr:copper chaperone PCu(A)C [Bauldia sp.]